MKIKQPPIPAHGTPRKSRLTRQPLILIGQGRYRAFKAIGTDRSTQGGA